MSSRGRGSWLAVRSDGSVLAFFPGNNCGGVGSKAVGNPDKTTLFDLVRKHFWASEPNVRALQSCLQTASLRLNSPSIANSSPIACFAVKRNGAYVKTCHGWQVGAFNWGRRHRARFLFPYRDLTRGNVYYRGAVRPKSGDYSFPRSEFRTAET